MKKISAEIILDSINEATGDRLTTFRILCPKFINSEICTHRTFSRNFSSSRAIPAHKMRAMVIRDPVVPVHWGANQKGMQASSELTGFKLWAAQKSWLWARFPACFMHWVAEKIGLHKQICNRLIEPWVWAEGVVSSTEWDNFWSLRCHVDAQPEFQELATQMQKAFKVSIPQRLNPGEWHLPFVDRLNNQTPIGLIKQVSTARCARVSYYLRDGRISTPIQDLELCDRLAGSDPKHLSPFEHIARAMPKSDRSGNFIGWAQYRKELEP